MMDTVELVLKIGCFNRNYSLNIVEKSLFALSRVVKLQFVGEVAHFLMSSFLGLLYTKYY